MPAGLFNARCLSRPLARRVPAAAVLLAALLVPRLAALQPISVQAAVAPVEPVHVEVEFIPYSAAHRYAAETYQAIWRDYGARIIESLERHSCLPFSEVRVAAVIADGVSHSGGPEHPMRLRASYRYEMKKSTLVHELGHRHLWQMVERLKELDGHQTLYLILDRVWADVWGEEFAADRVQGESQWRASYDYATAWDWARTLSAATRAQLWDELLRINGLGNTCSGLMAGQYQRPDSPDDE